VGGLSLTQGATTLATLTDASNSSAQAIFQMYSAGTETIRLYANSSFPSYINAGNVGIGTTSPTAALHLPASSTARASLCIPAGAAPTIPVEGDVWTASGKMYIYIGAVTKEIAFV
jgi:hypothetical protein